MFRFCRRKEDKPPAINEAELVGDTIVAIPFVVRERVDRVPPVLMLCKGPEFCERERQRVAALAAEVARLAAENEHLSSQLGDGLK